MARERSIVVRLKAEVSDFQSKMGQASRSLSDFEKSQQQMGGAATTTLGRMVQSAKINEREWTQVGRTMLGVGTAMAGMGVATLKTGIEYNSLRQKATQSLTAVTGSTEKASAQMRRLDEFGKNSWLMRDTLIRAQTQMSGFGIETNKVIPYMSALADAVAATGGTNQDFEELARLMGQIQSQGKITARELMQFGMRGIDAAQLIGDAMGKTAGQIRDEITAGTLDAGIALDALADGMGTRFAGASDLVRDSFAGAMDNLKAAWRDLSAELASPLVDPEGGGLLVGWVNNIADSMFTLKDAVAGVPASVKTVALAMGGLATAATLSGGAFMLALPKYVQLRESIATLAGVHPRVAKFAGGMATFAGRVSAAAGVAAAAAAAFGALASALKAGGATRQVELLASAFDDLRDSGGSLADMRLAEVFAQMPSLLGKTTVEAETLGEAIERVMNPDATDKLGMAFVALGDIAAGVIGQEIPSYMKDYEAAIASADEALTSMLAEGGESAAAATELIRGLGLSTEELAEVLPNAHAEMLLAADGADSLADGTDAAGDAADRAAAKMEEWISIVEGAGASFGGILDAYDAVISKNDDMALSTSQTMDQWIAELQNQANAVGAWRDNYMTALDQIRTEVPVVARSAHKDFVDEMLAAGEEGAAALQTFVDGTPEQRAQLVRAWQGAGYEIQELIEEGNEPMEFEVNTDGAQSLFQQLIGDWETTETETNLSANTDPGKDRANALMGDWENTTTETFLSADPAPAVRVFNQQTGAWENTTTDTLLDMDPKKAISVFNRETGTWQRTTTATLLNMDPAKAKRVFGINTSSWRNTTTNTGLGMNTSSASGTFSSARSKWRNTTTSTGLGLNTSSARSSFSGFRAWLAGQSLTKTITVIEKPGKYDGGFISKGLYGGGTVLPGRMAGGRVPGARAGYDNVMWPLHSGGRVLTQPLEGGEYVVRSSQANRADYAPILEAMNRGTFQAAPGPSVVVSSLSDSDVARIAVAVREGAAVGSERGARVGAREGLDVTSRRAGAGAGRNTRY